MFSGFESWLLEYVEQADSLSALAILAGSAMLEYVFPPFPGDTVTLFGAVLVTAYGWSFALVFSSVMLGSLLGSMLAFYLGVRLGHRRRQDGGTIDRLVARFERHGAAYLVINRFLPGMRALFFVAAGMAGMRARAVLFYSAVSAALWNLLLIAVGSAVGANFDRLLALFKRYSLAGWLLVAAVLAVWLIRAVVARARKRR